MRRLHRCQSAFRALASLMLPVLAAGVAYGQILNQQELLVHDLPFLTARSPHAPNVLLTSLATVFHDHEICCGWDSALGDSVEAADPKSLKDIASKLDGRHLMGDGRPIMVKATFLTPDAVNSGLLISWFLDQHAALMEWNSHLYVVHGITYMWTESYGPDYSGQSGTVILKFLLWDTRYSDARREVVFNREADDLGQIQGFLFLQTAPQ